MELDEFPDADFRALQPKYSNLFKLVRTERQLIKHTVIHIPSIDSGDQSISISGGSDRIP